MSPAAPAQATPAALAAALLMPAPDEARPLLVAEGTATTAGIGTPRCQRQSASELSTSTGSGASDSQSSGDTLDDGAGIIGRDETAPACGLAAVGTAAGMLPHVTLSVRSPVVWFARQLPLLLLLGVVGGLLVAAFFSAHVFLVIFVCLNLQAFLWSLRTSLFGAFAALWRLPKWRHIDWAQRLAELPADDVYSVQHYMLIPSYREELEVLDGTLESLAEARLASKTVRVVLAMEERDEAAAEVARRLCAKWSGRFLEMFATFHPSDLALEVAGKSSNINWAFQEVSRRARQLGLDPERTVISVTDADCVWHPEYFGAVTLDVLRLDAEERGWLIWQAPQLHLRNFFDVPIVTRMAGYASALYELGGLTCPVGTHLSYSSYSLQLSLADRVEGWDTDVIAEDWHMFAKCYFASANTAEPGTLCAPRLRLRPVMLPVKSFLVDSPAGSYSISGYAQSLRARFIQARRHMQGINEVAYVLLQWACAIRWHGLSQVPWRLHSETLSLVWTMLSIHNFPYGHLLSLLLAQFLYGSKLHEHGSHHNLFLPRSPVAACAAEELEGFERAQCYVFSSVPIIFMLPMVLTIIGSVIVVRSVVGAGVDEGEEEELGRYESERGGPSVCRCQRWCTVLFLQMGLELACTGFAVMVFFGFVPEVMAVWHLAYVGVQFRYVCAAKPTSRASAPDTPRAGSLLATEHKPRVVLSY